MKLPSAISKSRRVAGILLTECLVYIAVFAILTGIGFAAFYLCWDHSKALIYASDDISSALRAGERWRADVRAATGKIIVETNATGEVVQIPEGARVVSYRFESGEVRRQISASGNPQLLLANVRASKMEMDDRGGVRAWRWELELLQRRKGTFLPLRFTFEAAAQAKP